MQVQSTAELDREQHMYLPISIRLSRLIARDAAVISRLQSSNPKCIPDVDNSILQAFGIILVLHLLSSLEISYGSSCGFLRSGRLVASYYLTGPSRAAGRLWMDGASDDGDDE